MLPTFCLYLSSFFSVCVSQSLPPIFGIFLQYWVIVGSLFIYESETLKYCLKLCVWVWW